MAQNQAQQNVMRRYGACVSGKVRMLSDFTRVQDNRTFPKPSYLCGVNIWLIHILQETGNYR